MKNKNSKSNKSAAAVKQGPGRPAYSPIVPNKRFTFGDLCIANGVNLETGKGDKCTALTLRKWLAKNTKGKASAIAKLDGILAQPDNEKGLGRKSFVFNKRSLVEASASKSTKGKGTSVPAVTIAPATVTEPVAVTPGEPAPVVADATPATVETPVAA